MPIPLPVEHTQHGIDSEGERKHREDSQQSSSVPQPPLNSATATSKPLETQEDLFITNNASHHQRMEERANGEYESRRRRSSSSPQNCAVLGTKFRKEEEDMALVDRRHEGHGGAVKKMKECYVALLVDLLHYDTGTDSNK